MATQSKLTMFAGQLAKQRELIGMTFVVEPQYVSSSAYVGLATTNERSSPSNGLAKGDSVDGKGDILAQSSNSRIFKNNPEKNYAAL
eukprot:SAG31_NODE_5306_length_2620_cov_3.424038_4_plen_87_part_00